MYTLEKLQQDGCLSGSLVEVRQNGALTASQLAKMTEAEQASFHGVVIVDDAKWVATVAGMPFEQAKNVYSSDGQVVCNWKAATRTFCTMQLRDGALAVTKIFSIKEETRMDANLQQELANLDGLDLSEVGGETQEMKSFDTAAAAATGELSANEKKMALIREKMADEKIGDHSAAIINNQKYGRLITFVTKTDPVVKVSIKNTLRLDPQGAVIPKPDTPAEKLAEFKEKGKLAKSYCETEKTLQFTQAKPSKAIIAVIKTPTATDLDLLNYESDAGADFKNDGSFETHIISMETALSYIAYNYGGRIKEDDTVLGRKACWLREKFTPYVPKPGTEKKGVEGVRASLYVEKESQGIRKSLLTDGNFVPLKVYATIAQQDLSAADAEVLNLNIEAALKNKDYNELAASSKDLVKPSADGKGYTSAWFNDHKPINISRYDNSNESVTDVRIPVREKKEGQSKDGKPTLSYQYKYFGFEDRNNGPLANPVYAEVVKAIGVPEEEFIAKVTELSKASTRRSGKATVTLTPEEYLKVKLSKSLQADGTRSFKDLQAELAGLSGFGVK